MLLVTALASCGQGDRKVCEQACRNYVKLNFWNKWDPIIDKEPVAAREGLRRQKLGELEDILARGVDKCTNDCATSNNEDQYKCMAKAKTWKEANACAETQEQAKD